MTIDLVEYAVQLTRVQLRHLAIALDIMASPAALIPSRPPPLSQPAPAAAATSRCGRCVVDAARASSSSTRTRPAARKEIARRRPAAAATSERAEIPFTGPLGVAGSVSEGARVKHASQDTLARVRSISDSFHAHPTTRTVGRGGPRLERDGVEQHREMLKFHERQRLPSHAQKRDLAAQKRVLPAPANSCASVCPGAPVDDFPRQGEGGAV